MQRAFFRVPATVLAALCLASAAHAFDGWHQTGATPLAGPSTTWDYVSLDAGHDRLYIGHRKTGLQVFDLQKNRLVGIVAGTAAASSNGAVVIPEFDLGLSTNENGTLTPFSLSTLATQPSIKLGDELDSAHYDPVTKRLLVNMAADKEGTSLVVLEVPSLKKVGEVRISSRKPEHAEADGKGHLLMATRDESRLLRIDMQQLKVVAQWPVPDCAQANGLAYDAGNDRVFVGCRGTAPVAALTTPGPVVKPSLVVMNGQTGERVFAMETGGGNDTVAFDRELKRVFLANGVHSQLLVVEQKGADQYVAVEAVGVANGLRTMALHPTTKKLYGVTGEGSADYAGKITTSVSPYYANTFFPDRFTVYEYGR
ncbi:YncE family protein [Sphaerotilus sp.]|uniref:YncE family protein n=1 Tax=Sphaerotilus sp. TaxID=2093942 RepID=UPI0034E1D7E0